MTGWLRRLARDLTGRADRDFATVLKAQVDAAVEAADVALAATRHLDPATARDRMIDIEHAGDEHRAELIDRLSLSLTSPIDREDLYRLSRSLDDVLDNLRDFSRELDLFSPVPGDAFAPLLSSLRAGMETMSEAVTQLIDDPREVARLCRAAKKHRNELRLHYQHALAELYAGDLSIDTMKVRDLLRRLDVAGLRLGEAADALVDGAMKRSH
jgi:uncharacterized protein